MPSFSNTIKNNLGILSTGGTFESYVRLPVLLDRARGETGAIISCNTSFSLVPGDDTDIANDCIIPMYWAIGYEVYSGDLAGSWLLNVDPELYINQSADVYDSLYSDLKELVTIPAIGQVYFNLPRYNFRNKLACFEKSQPNGKLPVDIPSLFLHWGSLFVAPVWANGATGQSLGAGVSATDINNLEPVVSVLLLVD
jgi:hypothetical protein